MKITKVYTRTGDKGETCLLGGKRISKDSVRLEAYGTVDELSAHIGLLAAQIATTNMGNATEEGPHWTDDMQRIQSVLFRLGGHLSTDQDTTPLYPSTCVPQEETLWLEQQTDHMLALMSEQQGFILPGGTVAAAQCHVCRTICRRAERRIVSLEKVAKVGEEERKYINRLSDYLFVLARFINFNAGINEIIWQKRM